MIARLALVLALTAPGVTVVSAICAMLDADPYLIGLLAVLILAASTWVFVFEPMWLDRRQPGDVVLDRYERVEVGES